MSVKTLKVYKICSHCNIEFKLKLHYGHGVEATIATFENCPHCGKRNDTWLRIPPLLDVEPGEFTKQLRSSIRLRPVKTQCGTPVEVIVKILLINEDCDLIDQLSHRLTLVNEERGGLKENLSKAEAENKKLKADLSKYGNHKSNCAYIQGLKGNTIEDCNCGFERKTKQETESDTSIRK